MPFNTGGGSNVVPFYAGGQAASPPNVFQKAVAPSSAFVAANLGDLYINTATDNIYALVDRTAGVATWTLLGGATGAVATLTGGSGGAIAPVAGNITLAGTANQITTTGTAGTITMSLPAAITAPGSVTATTTLTATLGNITATNGNFVASTSGTGLTLPVVTASGAAGTVNCNGRVGSVTFTGVSIAAAADLTLTIGNTSIAGASTRLMLTMTGATTGSAIQIKSVTPSAGSYAIVVTNGTGATTTTANITFDFIVLN